jgi:hypothetical protein
MGTSTDFLLHGATLLENRGFCNDQMRREKVGAEKPKIFFCFAQWLALPAVGNMISCESF